MKKMMNWMMAATLVGCLFVWTSCSNDDDAVTPQPRPETEFAALLKTLDWGNDTCFVYGHKTPDVDAVASALSYARLMQLMGYNCKAKVSSAINRETDYIASVFGFALPELKSSVEPQTRLILTDHSEYAQCVDGAREAVVLQKIDHHIEGDIADSGVAFVRREMIGATTTIIYEMFKEQGVAIDDETARVMLAGIISDTRNLSKSATCAIDTLALTALAAQLNISADSIARLNRGMVEAASDYTGMTDADIFLSDYKEYDISGRSIGIGCLLSKQAETENFINRMLAVMPELAEQRGRQIMLCMIDEQIENTGDDRDVNPYLSGDMYIVYYGEEAKALVEAILGPSLREGVGYTSQGMSRKKLVSLITDLLNQ